MPTSKKVGSKAGKLLEKPKSPKAVKNAVGAALAETPVYEAGAGHDACGRPSRTLHSFHHASVSAGAWSRRKCDSREFQAEADCDHMADGIKVLGAVDVFYPRVRWNIRTGRHGTHQGAAGSLRDRPAVLATARDN